MSSHNDRIAAKREKSCLEFMQATSTNLTTAKHYLKQTAFDLDRAVSLFYDNGGEALPSDDEEVVPPEPNQNNQDLENDDISSIVNAAKDSTPQSSSFEGRGFSLNSSNTTNKSDSSVKLRVIFYKDGFTAQEIKEESPSPQNRRGVHTFSTAEASSLIPPLRKYEEHQKFIQDVKQSRVPDEYRRFDSNRMPIPVSIELGDLRSKEYPRKEFEKQQERQEGIDRMNPFHGAGQALGGATNELLPDQSNNQIWIFALLISLWSAFIRWLTTIFRQAIPLQKHVLNPEKPITTISLRMPGNKRERVEFNTDHTVEDLRRYCQIELSNNNNNNNSIPSNDFELMAGFPPRMIQINKDTLKDAGLINSAIEVRTLASNDQKRTN